MSILQIISLRFYQLRKGVVNLIVWFPVIWQDQQFDHTYFYKIMIKKLVLMEKFFLSEEAQTVSSKESAAQIKEMREALERLHEEDYLSSMDFLDHENAVIKYKEWALAEEKLIKKDLEKVSNILKNSVRNWWD